MNTDLETSYLHFRIDSSDESQEYVAFKGEGEWISISFQSKITDNRLRYEYKVNHCMKNFLAFPTTVPAEWHKIWTIVKRGLRIVVYCNGKKVLDATLSSSICDNPVQADTWREQWGQKATKVYFSPGEDESKNRAIDFYYIR